VLLLDEARLPDPRQDTPDGPPGEK